jgi:uncharacterized membrane protein
VGAALVWIVLIIVVGTVLVVGITMKSLPRHREIPPEQLLKTRFANGEIGEEEYVRRLAVLQHDRLLELED